MADALEIQVVGQESRPPRRFGLKEELRKAARSLRPGLTLRIVFQNKHTSYIFETWNRLCEQEFHKKPGYQQEKQPNGTTLVWLWWEEPEKEGKK